MEELAPKPKGAGPCGPVPGLPDRAPEVTALAPAPGRGTAEDTPRPRRDNCACRTNRSHFPEAGGAGRLSAVEPTPSPRRFFLDDPEADEPNLRPEEQRHASGVLRLREGDRILGLDGCGGLHPLMVRRVTRGELELTRDGEVMREPEPGTPGAPLPRIEVAAPLPKGSRAEEMLDCLTQLGIAAFRPLCCARNQGFARESAENRAESLLRACREACKQSRRSWLPKIHPTARPAELRSLLSQARSVLLDPGAAQTLLQWRAETAGTAIVVIAGPEGGFDEQELQSLDFAAPVALGPHVLRIETAVEAAVAALAQRLYDPGYRLATATQDPRPRNETKAEPPTTM